MKTKNNLISNITWSFTGNILLAFSQWFIILILTKYSDPNLLGKFSLSLAIVSPIFMFASFGLKAQIAGDVNKEYELKDYFTLRIWLLSIASIISIIIILLSYKKTILIISSFIIIQKVIEGLDELAYGYYIRINKIKYLGKSLILKSGLTIIFMLFLTITNYINEFFTAILMLASFINLLISNSKTISRFSSNSTKFNFTLLLKVFPLGISMGLISINSNIQKYFLAKYLTFQSLGYYTALIYFLSLGAIFYRSVVDGVYPYFVEYYVTRQKLKFWRLFYSFSGLVLSLSAAFIIMSYFFGEILLKFLYSKQYSSYSNILLLISFCSIPIFLNSVLGSCLTAIQQYKKQVFGLLINILISSITSIIFIPKFGIAGACYSLFWGSTINFIYLYFLINKVVGWNQ